MPTTFKTKDSDDIVQTLNTLPALGAAAASASLPVAMDTAVETAPGTPGTAALAVQGNAGGVPIPATLSNGSNRIGQTLTGIFYTDASAVLAANAVSTGATRDLGFGTSSFVPYSFFNAFFLADAAGTAKIQISDDFTVWVDATAPVAVAANTPTYMKVPAVARYHRTVFTNGPAAQTAVFRQKCGYSQS